MICVSVDLKQDIPDWKEYLMKRLVGAHTLPVDFYLKVLPDVMNCPVCHTYKECNGLNEIEVTELST